MTNAASIRASIESDIADGRLRAGDRLAPVRSLASDLGVSPNTVAAAYRQLRNRGVVMGRGRQGTIVAPSTRAVAPQQTATAIGLIDAARGTPDPAVLPDLTNALVNAARGDLVGYGDELLDPRLREAARIELDRDGIDAQQLAVTSGAMDAIARILDANDLRPGDRVGVEDPGHVPVHRLVRSNGLDLVPLPIDSQGTVPRALERAVERGLSALIVTPRAQNPTGAAITAERARELSEVLASHPEVLVVHDDHAGPIAGAQLHRITPPGERFADIRSLGKSLGPDLRVAVTAGDRRTIDRLSISIADGPGWVSHLLQRTAAQLLQDTDVRARVVAAEQTYSARRRRLIDRLAGHGVAASGPSGLNVWIPTDDEQATVDAARRAGFAIRGADVHRIASGPAVRVTISSLTDEQLDELGDALGAHLGSSAHRAPSA